MLVLIFGVTYIFFRLSFIISMYLLAHFPTLTTFLP
jgi:hypothetical protein